MHRACLITLLLFAFARCADGKDIYVDNVGGDDRFTGGAPTALGNFVGPCRTIGRALRSAEKGDRVILAATGEPYRESITLQAGRHSGVANKPFQLVGNGAILEGAFAVPQDGWEHVRGNIFRFSPPRKSFQMLFLDGRPAKKIVIEPPARGVPELKPLEWCRYERDLYFCVEDDRLPQDYALTYCGHIAGITLYEVRHVVISNLIIQGFQLDGINAHDGATEVTLSQITSRGNGRSGVSIGGASRVRIQDSLLGNNGTAQLRTEGFSHTTVTNTHLLDNSAPPLVQTGGQVKIEDGADDDAADRQARRLDRAVGTAESTR